jgi:hypothetical protein
MNGLLAASLHFQAPFKSLILLFIFQAEFLLLGTALSSWFRPNRFALFSLPDLAFLGQCAAVSFAQVWSLFGGLRPQSNICLLLFVAANAMLWPCRLFETLRSGAEETHWPGLLLVSPLWLVAALNALTAGFCYDSALYHLSAVRWVWEYGAVPGLANLHGRLGFNSALSSLAGLLGVPFGLRQGQEFVNPAIVVSVAAVLSQGLSWKSARGRDFQRTIYALSLFVPVVALVFSSCLSSPQPDVAAAAMAILAAWYFWEIVFGKEIPSHDGRLLLLGVSAASMAIQFKLSSLGLSLPIGVVATLLVYLRHRDGSLPLATALLAGILLFPWICSGYVRSGYPLFPSEFARINFDWAVPRELVARERDWMLSWAREPGVSPEVVLRNWNWLGQWVLRFWRGPEVIMPLLLTVTGLLIAFSLVFRREVQNVGKWFILVTPSIFALVFWFLTAPAPRFAEATLWIFAANVLICSFVISSKTSKLVRPAAVAVLLTLLSYNTIVGLERLTREGKKFPNFVGAPPAMTLRRTDSGLEIWVPTEGNSPGDSELLATPPDRFDPRLELRGLTLRQGFRIRN